MNQRALIKALFVSALVTSVVLSFLSGYSSSTTPDGITTHNYTLSWLLFSFILIGMFVLPVTFIVGYPVSITLIKLNLFNMYSVSIIGVLGAIGAVMLIFNKVSLAPMQAIFYGVGGLVGSMSAYLAYKKFNKALKSDAERAGAV